MKYAAAAALILSTALTSACAADGDLAGNGDDAAPSPAGDELDTLQKITSINADGTWTASAWTPYGDTSSAEIGATFTGPSGKTRKMGVCGLQRYGTGVACSTVANCNNAPTTLPSGGARYCTAPNGTGQKYCYYRPGSATTYCAGSPALGGTAVAPGAYSKAGLRFTANWQGATVISYGCFEGCTATDPSSSSTSTLLSPADCGTTRCP